MPMYFTACHFLHENLWNFLPRKYGSTSVFETERLRSLKENLNRAVYNVHLYILCKHPSTFYQNVHFLVFFHFNYSKHVDLMAGM